MRWGVRSRHHLLRTQSNGQRCRRCTTLAFASSVTAAFQRHPCRRGSRRSRLSSVTIRRIHSAWRRLTIHSSRSHFVARLNSGVRPLRSKASKWFFASAAIAATLIDSFGRFLAARFQRSGDALADPTTDPSRALSVILVVRRSSSGRASAFLASFSSTFVGRCFPQLEWRPNNSFKPNPLRGFDLNSSQTVAASPTGSSRNGSA
jgi:hypothetical protein